MKIIFFMIIGLSILYADFTKNGDIVRDNSSKLEWQDDTVGSSMKWQEAIIQCEALTLGSHSDWRLPNVNELKSIVDREKVDPAIVTGFVNISSYYYWSSSTSESFKHSAWFVNFEDGGVHNYTKDDNYYVRCVRDGQ